MKFSIQDLINSESYQKESESWAKSHIIVSFLVAAYVAFFTNFSIGLHWIWIIPTLLFGSALLLAMPTMFVNVFLASKMSAHMIYIPFETPTPKNNIGRILGIIKNLWSILALIITGYVTLEFFKLIFS